MSKITDNDKYVLNAIFNPNYPLDFDQEPATEEITTQNEKLSSEIKRLEEEGVKFAEQNHLTEAIDRFSQAIVLNPELPSAYNNRAQAYQLQNQTNEAMADLDTAIRLAADVQQHRKTLSLALTQRGVLRRFLGNEKEALEDFTQAADLGSNFAKQQVLMSNPFAAACNQMLSKMIKQASYNS